jgi:hypothetical protein
MRRVDARWVVTTVKNPLVVGDWSYEKDVGGAMRRVLHLAVDLESEDAITGRKPRALPFPALGTLLDSVKESLASRWLVLIGGTAIALKERVVPVAKAASVDRRIAIINRACGASSWTCPQWVPMFPYTLVVHPAPTAGFCLPIAIIN